MNVKREVRKVRGAVSSIQVQMNYAINLLEDMGKHALYFHEDYQELMGILKELRGSHTNSEYSTKTKSVKALVMPK